MTDNFELIKDFIQSQWSQLGNRFNSFKDAFYIIKIIGRAKDNSSIIAGSHTISEHWKILISMRMKLNCSVTLSTCELIFQ